ncbi:MAG: PEP-CTERM sorting domain-containing protein [Verrucomicrobia bacterium]|nr:PEP-CTERM sorting domain-containing protein [Verrucomicrobiota bacterium]
MRALSRCQPLLARFPTYFLGTFVLVGGLLAQPVVFPNFSSTAGLTLNSASATTGAVPSDGTVLHLVGTSVNDIGSVFVSNQVTVGAGFSAAFNFRLTAPGGITDGTGATGADGLVFVVQRAGPTALGGGGEGMGYQGIGSSIGIEFDTFYNPGRADPNSNHIGFNAGGNVTSLATAPVSPAFDNGTKWTAWVDYNGTTLEVRVANDGIRPTAPLLSQPLSLTATIGGSSGYVGFTAGTGSAYANHEILAFTFSDTFVAGGVTPGLPIPEPQTWVLLALGAGGGWWWRRRRH